MVFLFIAMLTYQFFTSETSHRFLWNAIISWDIWAFQVEVQERLVEVPQVLLHEQLGGGGGDGDGGGCGCCCCCCCWSEVFSIIFELLQHDMMGLQL